MIYRVTEGHDRSTDLAVLLGGLTTVAGIGMLVLARHPALHSIGITLLLGLAGAIPSALLVIPALFHLCSERRS
jgi:predicted exporter